MKKLTFNSTLNHKAHGYEPMQIEVEKVITLYGKSFEQLKTHPLDDVPEMQCEIECEIMPDAEDMEETENVKMFM